MGFIGQSASRIRVAIRSGRYSLSGCQRGNRLFNRVATRGPTTLVLCLTCAISGCSQSSGLPMAPSSPGSPTSPAPNAAPEVTAVIPALGSAAGGSIVKITGTGFMPGMIVAFDGIKATAPVAYPTSSFTAFYMETPAHAVGTVDLIVTNPDGQSQRVAGGYSYASPETFNMNGVWSGYTDAGSDTGVEFLIRDNTLVSAVCAYNAVMPFVFSKVPRVENGAFSLIADDGATLSGRIVSPSEMVGTINFPACNNTRLTWRVNRKDD